jgi:L-aminopeptidase/D-esterase-like protein
MVRLVIVAVLSIPLLTAAATSPSSSPSVLEAPRPQKGLTAVQGIKVGHHTLSERPTGCTVVLTEAGAVASVDVRGGAPGTRETDLLDPSNTVQQVHAIVISGGSAFGLDAAGGAMRYLEERDVGYPTRVAKVPIVPAAIVGDLAVGGKPKVRPTAECGYAAATAASDGPVVEGSVGAGAGATIGKLGGLERATKGGVGTSSITLASGLTVAALVVVNAVGDVIDPNTNRVVAGVRTQDGKGFSDARTLVRSGLMGSPPPPAPRAGDNTTVGVVATNAKLTKAQARKVAQMAHDGLARTVSPAHLPTDGDTIFALATGTRAGEANVGLIGALAAEAMADAIVRAATQATGKAGIPAARDLPAR